MNEAKITALYERLSREDGDNQESNSIQTQKQILEKYAEQNGLTPYRHFSDDGHSGKDFDRFGRSYLESGLYREMFRKMGVRFIAVNDAIDTAQGEFQIQERQLQGQEKQVCSRKRMGDF